MGHKVTIYEERSKLGGMLRYGIPSYRFPREKLDAEIASILSLGIEVRTEVRIGTGHLRWRSCKKQYDCLYICHRRPHRTRKPAFPARTARNVMSAVEMLRGHRRRR